jgi:hypothetical protein
VTTLKSGVGSRRRSKFSPGGRGSRFGGVGCAPPPRSGSVLRGGAAAQSTPARPPSPSLEGAAAGLPTISVRSPGPVSSPVAAVAGVGVGGASPVDLVDPGCQGLGGGPVAGEALGATVCGPGPSVPSPSRIVSSPTHSPSSPVFASRVRGVVYKWLWVPVGTLDLRSASPASLLDIHQWLRRTASSLSLPRLLRSSSMDRGREMPRAGSKRSFDDYDSDAGRRLEAQLRGRLEYAEARRQRDRDSSCDWDHRRSPEWRRDEERRREDERRSTVGPSFVTEQFSRKKVGVCKFSARSRAAAGAPTPTPPPQAPPAHPPPRWFTLRTQICQIKSKDRRKRESNATTAAGTGTTNLGASSPPTAVFVTSTSTPPVCVPRPASNLLSSGTDTR